jgi:hypothetical protein
MNEIQLSRLADAIEADRARRSDILQQWREHASRAWNAGATERPGEPTADKLVILKELHRDDEVEL